MVRIRYLRNLGSGPPLLVPGRIEEVDEATAAKYCDMTPPAAERLVQDQPRPVEVKRRRGRPKSKSGSEDTSSSGSAES